MGACDVDLDELSDGSRFGEKDASIDVRGIGVAACNERLVHQGADPASDLSGGDFRGDFLLELHGFAVTRRLGFFRDLVLHFCCA